MRIKSWSETATKWLNINNRGCKPTVIDRSKKISHEVVEQNYRLFNPFGAETFLL